MVRNVQSHCCGKTNIEYRIGMKNLPSHEACMAPISSSNCPHLIGRQDYLWAIQNTAGGMPDLCETFSNYFLEKPSQNKKIVVMKIWAMFAKAAPKVRTQQELTIVRGKSFCCSRSHSKGCVVPT